MQVVSFRSSCARHRSNSNGERMFVELSKVVSRRLVKRMRIWKIFCQTFSFVKTQRMSENVFSSCAWTNERAYVQASGFDLCVRERERGSKTATK